MLSLGFGGGCTAGSLALPSMSLRFLGLLWAFKMGTLWIDLVVQDLPKMSQFLVTTSWRPLKPGL